MRRPILISCLLLPLLLAPAVSCRQQPTSPPAAATPDPSPSTVTWYENSRDVYHGIPARLRFALNTPDADRSARLMAVAWKRVEEIGAQFNAFAPDSAVAAFNRALAGEDAPVPPELLRVLAIAQQAYVASDGAFDPSVLPLKRLWQAAQQRNTPPTPGELEETLRVVGLSRALSPLASPGTLRKSVAGVALDFGGIVKGWAVDEASEALRRGGVTAALVQIGGEVAAFGDNDGHPWRVGVQHPTDMQAIWGVVEATGTLRVSTSGNYRQPIVIAGKRYYHIFDPRTGMPVPERIAGVTLVDVTGALSSAQLDALATAVAVRGAVAGMALVRAQGAEAVIIEDRDGVLTERVSPGLTGRYQRR